MIATTSQRRFPFDLYTVAVAPLVPVAGLRALMGVDEDTVLAHIEDGQLPFAFDLAMPGARRAELRVWRGCIEKKSATLAEVLQDVLGPSPLPTLNVRTLRHRWVCSSTHVHHLIEAGLLAEVGGEGRKKTNTRNVTRTSAERFLTERRKA